MDLFLDSGTLHYRWAIKKPMKLLTPSQATQFWASLLLKEAW